jgi:hypothetical protein
MKHLILCFLCLPGLFIFEPANAQSSGPVSPDVKSFEPIDVTDAVNVLTGDFSYSLPIINVPGPEDGYPLALSYHAGISIDQAASWVGLGWTLNAGAINREVSFCPDDEWNAKYTIHTFWEGGTTYSWALGIPFGPTGLMIHLGFSVDTYNGFSINSMGASYGVFGGDMVDGKGFDISFCGFDYNVDKNHLSFSVEDALSNLNTYVSLGISLKNAIKNTQFNKSATIEDHSNPKISTKTTRFINPLHGIACSKTRYWIDDNDDTYLIGVLNGKDANKQLDGSTITNQDLVTTKSFDRYILHDIVEYNIHKRRRDQGSTNVNDFSANLQAEMDGGPSYPAYDSYSVTGQGISGSMRPYILENGSLFNKKIKNMSGYDITPNDIYSYTKKVNFRFEGEFSNSYTVGDWADISYFDAISNTLYRGPNNLGYKQSDKIKDINFNGYNPIDMHLAGENHIEWFTNDEIRNSDAKTKGFIDSPFYPSTKRAIRGSNITKQIGGFSITKSDGITYHYAIPMYAYGNYQYFENNKTGKAYKEINNPQPYAYTWLLSSITGPDYIDKNNNGIADEGDWGYWVNFKYGYWTDNYIYRTPDEGMIYDKDGSMAYSSGMKNVYYLDAIYTATHTALFVKNDRYDNQSVISATSGGYGNGSVPSLKLLKVILVKNSSLLPLGGNDIAGNLVSLCNIHNDSYTNYSYKEVLDYDDIKFSTDNILKSVVFSYNYSLCPQTPNSFDITDANTKFGKLTLVKLEFRGKNDVTYMPPYYFQYELETPQYNYVRVISTTTNLDSKIVLDFMSYRVHNVKKGDIIHWGTYYAVLLSDLSNNQCEAKLLGNQFPLVTSNYFNYSTTKNPPYTKWHFDIWGAFKSDFVNFNNTFNNDISHITSDVSKQSIDVWSLRKISTPVGSDIKVQYEPDSYTGVGVNNPIILNAKYNIGVKYTTSGDFIYGQEFYNTSYVLPSGQQGYGTPTRIKFLIQENNISDFIKSNFQIGQMITIVSCVDQFICDQLICQVLNFGSKLKGEFKIEAITDDGIEVSDPNNIMLNYTKDGMKASKFRHYASYFLLPRSSVNGGGLRVQSLSITDGINTNETRYEYFDGTTSYEPLGYDAVFFDPNSTKLYALNSQDIDRYKLSYIDYCYNHILLTPELPAPGVNYGRIRVKNLTNGMEQNSYNEYEFSTFNANMINFDTIYQPEASIYGIRDRRVFGITDRTSSLGKIKTHKIFNTNGQLLQSTSYNYSSDFPDKQGVFEEVHHEQRSYYLTGQSKVETYYGNVSVRRQYPCILTNTVTNNKGIQSSTTYNKFDFLNGLPTEVQTEQPNGDKLISNTIFAYTKYDNMGPKVKYYFYKNMLTQVAGNTVRKLIGPDWKVIDANIQTWNNDWSYREYDNSTNCYFDQSSSIVPSNEKVTRKYQTYIWKGDLNSDGSYKNFDSKDFDFVNLGANASNGWLKTNEITRYNHFSVPIELIDLNQQNSAKRMGYNNSKVIASATNTNYCSFAYSGFESTESKGSQTDFGGEYMGSLITNTPQLSGADAGVVPHTGNYYLKMTGQCGPTFSMPVGGTGVQTGRKYRASVWVHKNSPDNATLVLQLKNSADNYVYWITKQKSDADNKRFGDWILMNVFMDVPANADGKVSTYMYISTVSSPIYIDDIRIQPVDASVTAFTYDDADNVSAILNNDNFAIKYVYDAGGRVIASYKETSAGFKKISENIINYKLSSN